MSVILLVTWWAYVLTSLSRWIHSIRRIMHREDAIVVLLMSVCVAAVAHSFYPFSIDQHTGWASLFSLGLTLTARMMIPHHPWSLWIFTSLTLLLLRHAMLPVFSSTFLVTTFLGLFLFGFFLLEGFLVTIGVLLARIIQT